MKRTINQLAKATVLTSSLALCLSAGNAKADDGIIIEAKGDVVTSETTEYVVSERAQLGALDSSEVHDRAYAINLPPLSEAENQKLRAQVQVKSKKVPIGILRKTSQLPLKLGQELQWLYVSTGARVATVEVNSPEAKSIRLQINTSLLPEGSELRFAAKQDLIRSAQPQIINHHTGGIFWSPSVDSEKVIIELYIPSHIDEELIEFEILSVMHQMVHADSQKLDDNSLADIGWSDYCQVDAACATDISQDYQTVRTSTAKITFVDGGFSYLCSGTLMNDLDTATQIPYLLTANHCIDNQSAASSAEFYWFFSRSSCGYGDPTTVTRTTGGATLLSNDAEIDYSFMRLNTPAPDGAGMAGWTTRDARNTYAYGVHHPQGDVKKVSQGTTYSYYDYFYNTPDTHLLVSWQSGVTEGGSSGSGLWVTDGNHSQLVGLLTGGSSYCWAPSSPDLYGRFDLAFPNIRQWLADSSGSDTNPVSGQVNISGSVSIEGLSQIPVVALVLANGSFAFSINGQYSINAPVDAEGKITIFAWADGFYQHKEIFTPVQNTITRNIFMSR